MRFRPGLSHFTVVSADGRRRQFSWLWLLPAAAIPVILLVSLALFGDPLVRESIRRARYQPRARGEAVKLFVQANKSALLNLLFSAAPPVESSIPTLNLYVPNNTLESMQAALAHGDPALGHDPGGDQPYFDATLTDGDDNLLEGKVCLRGLSDWHHHPEKPSLRFKIKKDQVRGDRRYIELSRPEDVLGLKNWIPDQLAVRLGLMSDFSDHVRLFVNNKYFGVYLRSMRADEALALRNRRMSGTFYKGEFRDDWSRWEKDKVFDALWGASPTGWRSSGEEGDVNLTTFNRFLEVVRGEIGPQSLQRLERLLDMEVYAKWAAVMIVTGSSHTDMFHNQVFFLASTHGLLEAVPWDSNAYGMHSDALTPPDLVLHPVMELAISDPRWVHRRNQVIREILDTSANPEALNRLIDETVDRMLPDLEADTNLSSLELLPDLIPWSVLDIEPKRREIKAWAARRHELLRAYLDDAQVFVEPSLEREGWSRVEVAGSVAVGVARADGGEAAADTYPGSPALLYPGLTKRLSEYVSTPLWKQTHKPFARAAPLAYLVRGMPGELSFTNAITGAALVARAGRYDGLEGEARTVHPASIPPPASGDVVLGPGEILLRENLLVGAGQRLIINPGTTLRLSEGVGIYSRGQTLVRGTSDAPVHLIAADARPWAAFAISGEGTRGSRFEHMLVRGGSTGSDEGVYFKGMFNAYESGEVTLRNCRFGPNELGDDTVNLGVSRVLVEDCEWDCALSDALDLDMCTGVVRRCRFRDSGNDGLDLMGCDVVVRECVFERSGDKGISVGEDSRVDVRDSAMLGCNIGVEIKDRSHALIACSVFDGNMVALHSYQKKWLYGVAGTAALVDCEVKNSGLEDFAIEKRGRLLLQGTVSTGFSEGVERITIVDALDPAWDSSALAHP